MKQTSSMTAVDICAIIEAGHKGGVSRLKLGALLIEFTPRKMEPDPILMHEDPISDQSGTTQATTEQDEKKSREPSEADLDDLLITDPAAYEKLILSGELGDERREDKA